MKYQRCDREKNRQNLLVFASCGVLTLLTCILLHNTINTGLPGISYDNKKQKKNNSCETEEISSIYRLILASCTYDVVILRSREPRVRSDLWPAMKGSLGVHIDV